MPTEPTDPAPTCGRPAHRDRRRVVATTEGPVLIEGPVEIVLDDGSTVRSDRFLVAICACRRSRRYPFCDTSHRKRVRLAADHSGAASESGCSSDE